MRLTPYVHYSSRELLFSLQDLYKMQQCHRFEAIFATLDITSILSLVRKKSLYGAPASVNYTAAIYSLIARIVERISTIKDLVRRLRADIQFRMDCGFMLSESIPSEASYSRLIQEISQSHALEDMQVELPKQAMVEQFVSDDTVPIDATHVEARDQAPTKAEKEKSEPKKRFWRAIAKERSAVERVNAYLKEYFGLNHVRHHTGEKARAHLNLVVLVYNSTKLACDRLTHRADPLS